MPVYIDHRPYPSDPSTNLLDLCLSLGLDLPYFCWHPAMGSVGACRQCAVKQYRDENDRTGRIVMACMTAATDGTRIGVDEPEARAFRAAVIEWLMTNHPHDCPVCEEGGECHLQDMTLMTGHNYRRYRGPKRTFRNQYLGPFVNHEMNRCIACYRCVRFYQEYAGGRDLDVFAAHNHVFFGRHEDGVLESEFSGNLAEVCPTGVFTDKPFGERYVRKWDLRSSPSLCAHCGLGCNTSPNERYGIVRRVVNRYNGEVNGHFLCDRGRFGYDFANGPRRIRKPLARVSREGGSGEPPEGEELESVGREQALYRASRVLTGGRTIGIGSPRASLEANFALRALVGADNFFLGFSRYEGEAIEAGVELLKAGAHRFATLAEMQTCDAVLVLGEDIANTAPRAALALRQAVRSRQMRIADQLGIPRWQDAAVRDAAGPELSPLFVATPAATRIDDVAAATLRATGAELIGLGLAVAHEIDPEAPSADLPDRLAALAARIADALRAAERPLIVSGASLASRALVAAAANVASALDNRGAAARLVLAAPECNSIGLMLMGGEPLERAFERAERGQVDGVIVLENDLYRRADRRAVARFLHSAKSVIALDHVRNETVHSADVVLPAATFAESNGTLVSFEGRAQRFFRVHLPAEDVRSSWRWLHDLAQLAAPGEVEGWRGVDDVARACSRACSGLAGITAAAPSADFRIEGERISRAPSRYSGRTAMHAHEDIHEPVPPTDFDTPLTYTMEGYYGRRVPAPLKPYYWAPGWNSVQSVNKHLIKGADPVRDRWQGASSGVRLYEPRDHARARYFTDGLPDGSVEPRARGGAQDLAIVPLYHVFGSEELSALAPAVAERVPAPYAAVSAADAAERGIGSGEPLEILAAGLALSLPALVVDDLPRGVIGLPVGLAAPYWDPTATARVSRAGT